MNIRSSSSPINFRSHIHQQRHLRSDIDKSLTRNARSFGRQTNRQGDQVELKSGQPEKALRRPQLSKGDQAEGQKAKEKPGRTSRPKDELFAEFGECLSGCFEGHQVAQIMAEAQERAAQSGQDVEPFVAALAFNKARARMRELMPGASENEIRVEAASNPELGKVVALADSASKYVRAVKKEGEVENKAGSEDCRLSPDKAMSLTAEQRETMNKVWEIQQKMLADMRKSFEEIQNLIRQTNLEISEMWLEGYRKRMALQDKQFLAFLQIIAGPKE